MRLFGGDVGDDLDADLGHSAAKTHGRPSEHVVDPGDPTFLAPSESLKSTSGGQALQPPRRSEDERVPLSTIAGDSEPTNWWIFVLLGDQHVDQAEPE